MKIKTSKTNKVWAQQLKVDPEKPDAPDLALEEASRYLSQAARSPNLVVLAGLGTSLCVTDGAKRLAPTMDDLSKGVAEAFSDLDDLIPLVGKEGRWETFRRLANIDDADLNFEHLLSRAKAAAEFLTGDEAKLEVTLLEAAEDVIRKKVDFLTDKQELSVHQSFLRRIARRSARLGRIKLFTTNYDLCFEVAGNRSGFIVVDGFAFGSDAVFNPDQFNFDVVRRADGDDRSDYIQNLFQLFKMHGSIDWELNDKTGDISKVPQTKKPLLIYPRSTKYEMAFSRPYVEMMGNFQAALRSSNATLLIVGFGFNDKHIAEPILAAVRSNLSLNVIVVDPAAQLKTVPGEHCNEYVRTLSDLIEDGDARIALVEAGFEDLVPLIPDIVADTELERHQERVRRLGGLHVPAAG